MGTEADFTGAGKRGKPVFCPVPEMRGTDAQAGRIRRGGDFALEQTGYHEEVQKEIDMPQYEFEILERIKAGEPAWVILDDALPTARSRFRRLTNSLIKLMDDIQEEFPDASLYTGSGGFNLLLGSSHNAQTNQPQQDLVAESANARLVVGDGDW